MHLFATCVYFKNSLVVLDPRTTSENEVHIGLIILHLRLVRKFEGSPPEGVSLIFKYYQVLTITYTIVLSI